jgi:predicted nuclease with RNAse H fold
MNILFGIDYGSRHTGNTVIAILNEDSNIVFMKVDKNVDADRFIYNAVAHFKPSLVFMDCPLSIPGVYTKIPHCTNYHLRKADQELRAMSPMFLGGMVARAMELCNEIKTMDFECKVVETYPKILALQLGLKAKGYKGSNVGLKNCKKLMSAHLNEKLNIDFDEIKTWHHFDALLALLSAIRHRDSKSDVFGLEEEGLIIV